MYTESCRGKNPQQEPTAGSFEGSPQPGYRSADSICKNVCSQLATCL